MIYLRPEIQLSLLITLPNTNTNSSALCIPSYTEFMELPPSPFAEHFPNPSSPTGMLVGHPLIKGRLDQGKKDGGT